ncbi:MAG: MarR family winged helix-turn-helix transcriptional regulator [Stenotrophomonas sp.]|uniref:MarR family winged helix-turn-helix transcriptional regulator n=1 Tax=Stenotrophomonas sp. TaxID=69392 RepID=UPI003D6C7C66
MLELKHAAFLAEMQRSNHADDGRLALCFQLLSLGSAIDRDCANRLAPLGLTEGRFVLLFLLRTTATGLSPHKLAERAGVTRATVTGLLDGLEREKLVSRRTDPDDKRRIHVQLTEAGQALAAHLFEQHAQWIASLFADTSTEERRILGTLLQRVWLRTDTGRAA